MVSSTSLILASSPPSWAALASSTRSFRSYASSSAVGTKGDREEHRSAWPPPPPPPESPPRPHLAAAAACPGHPAAVRQPRPAAAVPGCLPAARPGPGAPPAPAPCGTGPAVAPPAPDRQQGWSVGPPRDPPTRPPYAPPVTHLLGLASAVPRGAGCLLGARGCQAVVGTFHLQGICLSVQEPDLPHGICQLLLCARRLRLHLGSSGTGGRHDHRAHTARTGPCPSLWG